MEKWVISCNPDLYDVERAYNDLDAIHWKQSANVEIGDIVYIYVGKPIGAIKYETKAIQVNLPNVTIDDKEYILDGSLGGDHGRYMELHLLRIFEDQALPYKLLKENGLESVQWQNRIDNELEDFILNRTVQVVENKDKRYFFVFQNKSYDQELKGGYLWAPQLGKKGKRVPHWDRMKEVRKGDVIIHSFFKEIVAISVAKSDVYEFDRPFELPEEWENKGWKVDTEYFTVEKPIVTSEHMARLMELQSITNAPFNRIGRGNNGYLFAATKEMAEYIIKESAAAQLTAAERRTLLNLVKSEDYKNIEGNLDQELIDEVDDVLSSGSDEGAEYIPTPKKRPEAIISGGKKSYKRDKKISANALARAKHNCEINEDHPSFTRRRIDIKYAEPHHLIPMSKQDLFDNSLDVEANIISLCSNCHNQIHYGVGAEKLIEALYKARKNELEQAKISISLEDLLKSY